MLIHLQKQSMTTPTVRASIQARDDAVTVATAMRILPTAVREWPYQRIARNRYRFGRSDMCAIPDELLRRRLMT